MRIYFKEIDGRPTFFSEAAHGARMIDAPQTKRERAAGKRPAQIPNPDCLIPDDAIEISADRHAALLAAQSDGKQIVARGGNPVLVDPQPDPELRRRRRNRLLVESDWTQLADTLTGDPALKLAWAVYRQELRDLDMTGTDWPVAPGAEADDGAA